VFYCERNELDINNNSPLCLAVKLQNLDAVIVLTDAYCSAKLNANQQLPSPFELACALKNRPILEVLMNSVLKLKEYFLDLHKEIILKTLESLPDFSLDLHFECTSSFIPFISNLAPSDTYKIYKRGSNLRLDMTLVGFRKLQSIRGNLTVIYKGRGTKNVGQLLLVDHERKAVRSIFEETVENKLERDLDSIMKDENILKKYRPEHFKIDLEKNGQGKPIEKKIEGFMTQKYSVNSVYTMTKYK